MPFPPTFGMMPKLIHVQLALPCVTPWTHAPLCNISCQARKTHMPATVSLTWPYPHVSNETINVYCSIYVTQNCDAFTHIT